MVADLLQQAEGSAQRGAEHVHRHQAAVPRRHGRLHQHLLDVGDRRTLILRPKHREPTNNTQVRLMRTSLCGKHNRLNHRLNVCQKREPFL